TPSTTPATPALATPSAPHGSGPIPANELVRAPDGLAEAVAELLCDVVVTADLEQARRYVRDNPGFKAVTRDGDLLGAYWAQGGGARSQSLFEMRAAAEEDARQAVARAQARRHEVDAAAAEVSGRLGRLAGAARAAREEAARLDGAITSARQAAEKDLARLEQLRAE